MECDDTETLLQQQGKLLGNDSEIKSPEEIDNLPEDAHVAVFGMPAGIALKFKFANNTNRLPEFFASRHENSLDTFVALAKVVQHYCAFPGDVIRLSFDGMQVICKIIGRERKLVYFEASYKEADELMVVTRDMRQESNKWKDPVNNTDVEGIQAYDVIDAILHQICIKKRGSFDILVMNRGHVNTAHLEYHACVCNGHGHTHT
tara:strand:- start:346 stop:957 length:612 start_codon:yes stop_codon:yes gene_type:complete